MISCNESEKNSTIRKRCEYTIVVISSLDTRYTLVTLHYTSDVNRLINLNRLKMSFNRLLIAIKNFNRLNS